MSGGLKLCIHRSTSSVSDVLPFSKSASTTKSSHWRVGSCPSAGRLQCVVIGNNTPSENGGAKHAWAQCDGLGSSFLPLPSQDKGLSGWLKCTIGGKSLPCKAVANRHELVMLPNTGRSAFLRQHNRIRIRTSTSRASKSLVSFPQPRRFIQKSGLSAIGICGTPCERLFEAQIRSSNAPV
jgi:hypothetical protein